MRRSSSWWTTSGLVGDRQPVALEPSERGEDAAERRVTGRKFGCVSHDRRMRVRYGSRSAKQGTLVFRGSSAVSRSGILA